MTPRSTKDKEYDPEDASSEFQDGESKMGFDTVH